jgi:hypothetical protein
MQVWKIRLKLAKHTEDWDRRVEANPRRSVLVKVLQEARGFRFEEWGVGALLGLYADCYEKRYRRKWPFSVYQTRSVLRDLSIVLKRAGAAETRQAIEVVFGSKDLRWVNGNHAGFLASQDNYGNYVVPAMDRYRPSGEQSEWTGFRSDRSSSRVLSFKGVNHVR